MKQLVESINTLLPDEKIYQDVQFILDHEANPARVIFSDKGTFPIDGKLSIILKQFIDWRYDVVASDMQYITVIVALGEVQELLATLGAVEASYGFVTLFYDYKGDIFREDWHTSMLDE